MSEEIADGTTSLEWLNNEYIRKILKSYEGGKEVDIIKYVQEAATKKGENFASTLVRVRIEYIPESSEHFQTLSVIVKSRLGGEVLAEIESEFSIYDREAQMYKQILKSCESMLQSIGDNTQFGPRAIYVDDRIIVLEDLKEKGYKIMDVRKGLDTAQCTLILEKLAKLHATSGILYEKDPELFKYHVAGNITKVRTPLHDIYENTIETCAKYVAAKKDLSQFAEKLKTFGTDIIQRLIDVFSRDPNGFNVLNHGDMWVNNFMFKHDPLGNIEDVLLVDYQEGYYGSPGIDFNYFIYSSWNDNVFRNHRDDLISSYFKILIKTLTSLGASNLPTTDIINREIHSKGDHGIITTCCMYPILVSPHPELADPVILIVNNDESEQKRLKLFDSKDYYDQLKLTLPDFVERKLL